MLSIYGNVDTELSNIVKIELTSIRPKAGHTATYSRCLFITTDEGYVFCLRLRAEKKEALQLKNVE